MQKKFLKILTVKLDPNEQWPHEIINDMPEFKESADLVNTKLDSTTPAIAFGAKRFIKSQTQNEMVIHWTFSDLDSADPTNLSEYFGKKMFILSSGDLADSEKTVGNPPRVERYNRYYSKLLELYGKSGIFISRYEIVYEN